MAGVFKLHHESDHNYVITYRGRVVAELSSNGDRWRCVFGNSMWKSAKLDAVFDSGKPTIAKVLNAHPYISATSFKRRLSKL